MKEIDEDSKNEESDHDDDNEDGFHDSGTSGSDDSSIDLEDGQDEEKLYQDILQN